MPRTPADLRAGTLYLSPWCSASLVGLHHATILISVWLTDRSTQKLICCSKYGWLSSMLLLNIQLTLNLNYISQEQDSALQSFIQGGCTRRILVQFLDYPILRWWAHNCFAQTWRRLIISYLTVILLQDKRYRRTRIHPCLREVRFSHLSSNLRCVCSSSVLLHL